MRRRHRFYRHVFVVSLLVMASMPLPYSSTVWHCSVPPC